MRSRIAVMLAGAAVVSAVASPVSAAPGSTAGCTGQVVGNLAPALRRDFGSIVADEARTEDDFGRQVAQQSRADRSACL